MNGESALYQWIIGCGTGCHAGRPHDGKHTYGRYPFSLLAYIWYATPIWRRLLRHAAVWAARRARAKAGSSSEIRTAMMPITTSNSISVKPRGLERCDMAATFRVRSMRAFGRCATNRGTVQFLRRRRSAAAPARARRLVAPGSGTDAATQPNSDA